MSAVITNVVVWVCALVVFSYCLRQLETAKNRLKHIWAAAYVAWWGAVAVAAGYVLLKPFLHPDKWQYSYGTAVFIFALCAVSVVGYRRSARSVK